MYMSCVGVANLAASVLSRCVKEVVCDGKWITNSQYSLLQYKAARWTLQEPFPGFSGFSL